MNRSHLPPWRPAATLLAGALALTACAQQPPTADARHRTAAVTMAKVTDHPPIPGANLPDPARSELTGSALERMQSGTVFSRRF